MDTKWTRGCGVGCTVLVLLVVALAGGGLWYARRMASEFDVVRDSEQVLVERFGAPEAWVPATVVPAPERVARFAEVRADLAEWRVRLAVHTASMTALERGGGNPLGRVVRSIRAGSELATVYAGFWTARNQALLAAEMGPGEYIWFYHLVYHAWLGHDPGAGSDQGAWYVGETADGERTAELAVGDDDGMGTAEKRERARRQQRERFLPLLEAAMPEDTSARAWVEAERERVAADPDRVPWQTDLPEAVGAVFDPYRDALAAGWDPLANPVELLFEFDDE
jgi:hypothetical protein